MPKKKTVSIKLSTGGKKPTARRQLPNMLKELTIADIKIGKRHRRDMGDLTPLADSIRRLGLLQPIGVTDKLKLVFGERRLRAQSDILQKKTILAHIVNVNSIVSGEYAENEIRKDFTPSERVAIAKAIEQKVGNRQGQRTDRCPVGKIPQVAPGKKTREIAAEKAGFGNDKTYRQAAKVVQNGTPKLIQAMDDGRVSISAASILTDADPDEQEAIVELDAKAILQAAKEIRTRHAEKRAKHQAATTVKPQSRTKKQRLKATRLIHGDCRREMKKLRANSIDLILTDPPYPEIDREYGRLTEDEWHDLMHAVVTEGRRVLKPNGSMVFILQPNFEKIGQMRVWL
jgi:ParB-like nuclease family protein/DNA methylase